MMLRRIAGAFAAFLNPPQPEPDTWVDPTGVTLRAINTRGRDPRACRYGIECWECGCPGWTCVDPTTCVRSHDYEEPDLAAR